MIKSDKVEIYVVAGDFEGKEGVAPTFTDQTLLRGSIQRGGKRTIELPSKHNSLVYLLDGELKINDQVVRGKDMVVFENEGEKIDFEAIFDTRFIVLSGEPIGEKIESYGPYVMNTQTQIMEAMRDYQIGKMGILIEEFD